MASERRAKVDDEQAHAAGGQAEHAVMQDNCKWLLLLLAAENYAGLTLTRLLE